MKIQISDTHALDLESLLDTRLLIQANSGAGKSWALRRLLEQSHGKVQHLVIDPEGEFATLRERFDYVLAAPRGGDTPAVPRSAALLAERLLELSASAILDIFELKAHERILFVRRFLEALIDSPKKLWHPVLVVIDEASIFCPQSGEAESSGAVIDLACRGRKRGLCAVLAIQRLSKLDKDAAAECNNKLIGRTGLDVDVRRAADELGFGKERWRELRELDAGHFFGFGPALSRQVTPIVMGKVQTTHPKAGHRIAAPPPPPRERVRELLPKLADLPAEAEERQRTLEDLKRDNANLRRELTAAKRAAPVASPAPTPKPERVEVPVLLGNDARRLESAAAKLLEQSKVIATASESLILRIRPAIEAKAAQASRVPIVKPPLRPRAAAPSPATVPARANGHARPSPASTTGGAGLTGPEQRVLDALAWWESIGVQKPSKIQVGFVAGYRVGVKVGGTFGNILGALRAKELIDYPFPSCASLTDEGLKLAQLPDEEPTTDQLQTAIFNRLDGPEQRVLRALIERYPEPTSKQETGAESGYQVGDKVGGTFGNILGRLRSLGLIDYPSPGSVVALPVLFVEAR